MSLDTLRTKLLQQECHFTWSLREDEDFVLCDLLYRLEEQIELESDKARVTRAYSSFAFIQYLNGKQQEALANLQTSVQLAKKLYRDSDEALIVTYGDLAWLHYHMNEISACEDYLRQLDRIQKKFSEGSTYDMEVLREKGWAFLKFSYKYHNAAKECFRQALEINPSDSDLNAGYALALYRTTKETSDSLTMEQLKKAIKLNPDDGVLLVMLALRMQHNKDDVKAAQLKVIKALLKPYDPHVIRYAAKFYRQLGEKDDAIKLLEEALKETPNSAFVHYELAMNYKSKKISLEKNYRTHGKAEFDVEESTHQYLSKIIYHLEVAVSLKPTFIIAVADLALQYGQSGCSKAKTLFDEAFKLANKEKQHLQAVYNFYGQYQLYSRRSEELAIHNFSQGLMLQPKSKQGRMCEESLERIIKHRINRVKNPNDSKVCAIQGFIHEVKGEKVKAVESYERAQRGGLDFGESFPLTGIRIWLMEIDVPDKCIGQLIFDNGTYDEVSSGKLKVFEGSMNNQQVHLVDVDISNIKRILKWEKLSLGPHVVLLAFSLHRGQFAEQTREMLENLQFLGEKFWNRAIVVFKEGDCCINDYTGAQRSTLEWLLEKCRHNTYIFGYAPEITERRALSERIQRVIRRNNSMHLVLPDIFDGDSQSPSHILSKLDEKDFLFYPDIIIQGGQSKYRLQCRHAGWYRCAFTQIGFNMESEGEVLYSTVLQESVCPVPANHYQAGPLYDIKCVQGELTQLRLPHCEASIEDAHDYMSVIHYSNQTIDILKPQNITSTHVTVTISGTSKFLISRKVNWFNNRVLGQVMIFYKQQTHKLHVFLLPRNVDPREVEKCDSNYKFIQLPCECMLKYNGVYSMSCDPAEFDPVDEHGLSERPVPRIQPKDTKVHLTKQWKHFYPTFDITLPDGVMNVCLHLKKRNDKKGKVKDVWDRDITITEHIVENSRPDILTEKQCESFLKCNRVKLIKNVRNAEAVLDHLVDIIEDELMSKIRAMNTTQEKMRSVFDIIEHQGHSSKQKFFSALEEEEEGLIKEMKGNH
ncbi:interferon-induced protein with tetratricopeptide repeats 5 [Danio rerio]|uniref:Interferon-induced protein with tetratricopeptide repeats 5 n=1 Tax=Danio rerio TaxID=7955 RepID=A0A0G2KV16_DANRE|nr:interferon-induced protein with tetratricopeptide repeats 5 [Danio rerio]|eukprot:NP_001289169.1 interferon-induced protein with tetratricopeptide repeats 5 [Danio rerio]